MNLSASAEEKSSRMTGGTLRAASVRRLTPLLLVLAAIRMAI